jgi:hypothetical protein
LLLPSCELAELVARQQHRRAVREQQRRHQVAHVAAAQGEDRLVVGRALDAEVDRQVVAVAVAIVLAVGLVVTLLVGGEVGEGEAVMGGDEVDARPGPASPLVVDVAGAGDAGRHVAQEPVLALPEAADRVAVLVVPLGPARREAADLVAARPDVPGLADELHLAQHRVLADGVEEAAARVEAVRLAAEDGAEVEAEAVHLHHLTQ